MQGSPGEELSGWTDQAAKDALKVLCAYSFCAQLCNVLSRLHVPPELPAGPPAQRLAPVALAAPEPPAADHNCSECHGVCLSQALKYMSTCMRGVVHSRLLVQ